MSAPHDEAKRHAELFAAQGQLADVSALIEGEVTSLRGNGFTDEQARAIVAFMFGWRPADGSTPEGREGLG